MLMPAAVVIAAAVVSYGSVPAAHGGELASTSAWCSAVGVHRSGRSDATLQVGSGDR